MRTTLFTLSTLAACAGEPTWADADAEAGMQAASLPVEHAASTIILRLTSPSVFVTEGSTVRLRVAGLPPLARAFLALSPQLTGPAACPAPLAPVCIGIPDPFFLVGSAQADLTGTALVDVAIPQGVAPLSAVLQAVALRGADVYLSNTVDWEVVVDDEGLWVTDVWDFGLFPVATCDTPQQVSVGGAAQGVVASGGLYMADTRSTGFVGSYDELHTLDAVAYDPGLFGGVTTLGRTLRTNETMLLQTADVSSSFSCTPGAAGLDENEPANFRVTFALATWLPGDDPAVDPPADCVIRGHDPAELANNASGRGRTPPPWVGPGCRLPAP